jgi:HSP20 family protein
MPSITRYDPIADVFDDLLKGFFVQPVSAARRDQSEQSRAARIDIVEQNGEYKVHAELPGVKKEDIKVQIDGNQVSISAETRVERDAKEGERVLHSERYYGKIARTFRLDSEVDDARTVARYENGILELVLPKKEQPSARQITIQ